MSGSKELSVRALGAIEAKRKQAAVIVSAISCWEIGALVAAGRLDLTMPAGDWIARSEAQPFLSIVPIDGRIALRAAELPPVHTDPADRIIVATALSLGVDLVTKDERLREYAITTVW
jgi:PIN domain nuclease of toxin-antitoxin system